MAMTITNLRTSSSPVLRNNEISRYYQDSKYTENSAKVSGKIICIESIRPLHFGDKRIIQFYSYCNHTPDN